MNEDRSMLSATELQPMKHIFQQCTQGGPIKTAHFSNYHIFTATTDIIMLFFCGSVQKLYRKKQATIFLNE